MAVIQLGTTKNANALINYADDKRAVERSGIDCDIDIAKEQFKSTRNWFNKNNGVQAHHVIQSFKPEELTPQKANEIGQELAKEIAPGHEVLIFTHADKNHIHNHIVINNVNFENGYKLQLHGRKAIEKVREKSDFLCELSIIKKGKAPMRYTLAEKALNDKGKDTWKDKIRVAIERQKPLSKNLTELKKRMEEFENIKVKSTKKTMTFENQNGMKIRAKKLGHDYEKGSLQYEFSKRKGTGTIEQPNTGIEQDVGLSEKLHSGSNGQSKSNGNDNAKGYSGNGESLGSEQQKNELDLDSARETLERERKKTIGNYDNLLKQDASLERPKSSGKPTDSGQSSDVNKSKHDNNKAGPSSTDKQQNQQIAEGVKDGNKDLSRNVNQRNQGFDR